MIEYSLRQVSRSVQAAPGSVVGRFAGKDKTVTAGMDDVFTASEYASWMDGITRRMAKRRTIFENDDRYRRVGV